MARYYRRSDFIDDIVKTPLPASEPCEPVEECTECAAVRRAAMERDPDWHRDIDIMREEIRGEDREAQHERY